MKRLFFLILSQWIHLSFQQCLNTTRINGSLWAFSLAQVDDLSNPLGPQEACYWSCGGQIVTNSANKGNMERLTLMDKSAPILTNMGFLQSGQVYLLNHLGMTEEEGGNGIGCFYLLGNKTNHYPRTHQICAKANIAVCGFWGPQLIPGQEPSQSLVSESPLPSLVSEAPSLQHVYSGSPTQTPSPNVYSESLTQTSISQTLYSESPTQTVYSGSPWQISSSESPSQSLFSESPSQSWFSESPSQNLFSESPSQSLVSESPLPTSVSESPYISSQPSMVTSTSERSWQPSWRQRPSTTRQRQFPTRRSRSSRTPTTTTTAAATTTTTTTIHDTPTPSATLIPLVSVEPVTENVDHFTANNLQYQIVSYSANSSDDASTACQKNNMKLSDITSQKYDQIAVKLKTTTASGRKLVIGFWNNDSYSFSGDDCLILQVNYGIYPGSCSEATAVLCESQ